MSLSSVVIGQNAGEERIKHFNLEKGIAIQGYDPVAYFTMKKARKGNPKIELTSSGVKYLFSTEENKKEFEKNPSKYEPQYGGWCAYAIGDNGKKVEINPETFKILDGKLYLFYNAYFNNTLKEWNKNEQRLKENADKNWSIIIK
jgi:YHS domain-containing protein